MDMERFVNIFEKRKISRIKGSVLSQAVERR